MDLSEKKCKPCEGGVAPLNVDEIEDLKQHIKPDWQVIDNNRLTKEYLFVNFVHTMDFVNKVARLAEEEGHHPDMHVYYGRLVIDLTTHAIKGLSENDFILAYKIDTL
jgi:4a-hydroxytetrahydrobiopterin dehydratase